MSTISRFLTRTFALGLVLGGVVAVGPARADGPRWSEFNLPQSADAEPIQVVRQRSPGKKGVRFEVQPFPVEPGVTAVFELIALGEDPRVMERCVAVSSSRECWVGARRFEYGPGDSALMLRISATPEVVSAERETAVVASN